MKAVIIACGEGKRMQKIRGKDCPKPLIKLLGLTLIERVILSLKQSGVVDDISIVVGYKGEKIKEFIGKGDKYGVKITYIDNFHWQKGNALSVVRAKEFVKDNFLLLMADHIFESSIINEIVKEKLGEVDAVLAVDTSPQQHHDFDDATKVKIVSQKIVDLGKNLQDYDGFDSGIFFCAFEVLNYLHKAISEGKYSLTEGMREVARVGRLKAVDIKGKFWIDVDTPSSLQKAERLLLQGVRKRTDGFISGNINRPISLIFTKYLVNTALAPNMISFLCFIFCIISAFLLAGGSYFKIAIGGVIAQLASIFDGCDGEVARLKFKTSDYGGWFDALLDRYADALVILGMVWGTMKLYPGNGPWIWGFISLIGSFTNSYSAAKWDLILSSKNKKIKWRFGRDTRYFIIFLGAILNKLYFTLIVLGVITNFVSIKRLWMLKRKTSQRK